MKNETLNPEFVTGDKIQELGEYTFNVEHCINENKNINVQKLIDDQIQEINKKMPNIIFVYGHDIKTFLQHINRISNPFKLITHNSDLGIFEEYNQYINNKIIKWYGQNNYIQRENIFSLPIGIARARWPHGNLSLLNSIINNNHRKTNLVYKNFDIGTNIQERTKVNFITERNKIYMSPHTTVEQYWANMAKSCFIISPKGNGVDCHRIWESLYLKSVPVVEKHIVLKQFEGLPILFIDKWQDVTIDFLEKHIYLLEKFNNIDNIKMLNMSYWKQKIIND